MSSGNTTRSVPPRSQNSLRSPAASGAVMFARNAVSYFSDLQNCREAATVATQLAHTSSGCSIAHSAIAGAAPHSNGPLDANTYLCDLLGRGRWVTTNPKLSHITTFTGLRKLWILIWMTQACKRVSAVRLMASTACGHEGVWPNKPWCRDIAWPLQGQDGSLLEDCQREGG